MENKNKVKANNQSIHQSTKIIHFYFNFLFNSMHKQSIRYYAHSNLDKTLENFEVLFPHGHEQRPSKLKNEALNLPKRNPLYFR